MIRRGSEVVILDMEDVEKLVEGFRLVKDKKALYKKLRDIGCLEVYDELLSIIRERETKGPY